MLIALLIAAGPALPLSGGGVSPADPSAASLAQPGRAKSECGEPFRPFLPRLVVLFLDDAPPARLAEDKKLPTDRPCASTCELAGVFAHGKSALAFTRCGVQGFEGPGTKYTAYAGT